MKGKVRSILIAIAAVGMLMCLAPPAEAGFRPMRWAASKGKAVVSAPFKAVRNVRNNRGSRNVRLFRRNRTTQHTRQAVPVAACLACMVPVEHSVTAPPLAPPPAPVTNPASTPWFPSER